MHYQEVLKMSESIPYLSVRFGVGADFTWVSIMFPNSVLIGKPFKITHSDPQSRELTISKIKEAQEIYSLKSRCFLESIGIYHIPLLYFPHDKGFSCAVIDPIITKNSTNMNVKELHNDKFDSKEAAKVDLDASLKASIVPDDTIIDLRDLVRDYYYSKDLQSAIVLKLHAELKVSFPACLNIFSGVIIQTSLKLLKACPLATDMLAAPEDELVEITHSAARFGETYALTRYDAMYTAVEDAAVFGRALPSNTLRIRLYIKICRGYQARLDSILEELHQVVGKLEGTPDYGRISFIQTLRGIGFLSAVVLIAGAGSFDLFSSPKKLYAYLKLDPGISDSGKFHGDRVHIFKRGSGLTRRILYIAAISNLRVDEATKTPVSPITYDYYTRRCTSRKKGVAVRVVMYKICSIISTILRGNEPLELVIPGEHRERYAAEHLESVNPAV